VEDIAVLTNFPPAALRMKAKPKPLRGTSLERKPRRLWRWLAIIGVSCFLLSTVKPGQKWDGDAELYILNSLNILHGQPYASTDYVLNPTDPIHPAAYPPGLPMLLAPVIAAFGINYTAIKMTITLCYVAMLVVVASVAATFIPEPLVVILLVSLGLNPFVWSFKDIVFSELPFMLFAYLGLFAFDRLDQTASRRSSRASLWIWMTVCSTAVALAYEVRTIGITIFAAVAAMSVWRFKALRFYGPAILSVALALGALISWMFPADHGTYISFFGGAPFDMLERVICAVPNSTVIYFKAVGNLLAGSDLSVAQKIIVASIMALSALGVALSVANRPTVYETFLVTYLGALLLYPIKAAEPLRYALPVLPLLILYFLYSVHKWSLVPDGARKGIVVVVALGTLYLPQYVGSRKETISVDGPEAKELYREVRELVPPDATILCQKPTIIALYGERHATNPPENVTLTLEQFWHVVRQTKATWLVELKTPVLPYDGFSDAIPKLHGGLDFEFSNRLFALYRILGPTSYRQKSSSVSP
jgi:hypothetical protein